MAATATKTNDPLADFKADQASKTTATPAATSTKSTKTAEAAAKKREAAETQQKAEPELTMDPDNIAHVGVYEKRQERVGNQNPTLDYDPTHKFVNTRFVAGSHVPQRETSVMGTVHRFVKEAGKDGILGKDLCAKLRRYKSDNIAKSRYLLGVRPIGWAEGYVVGAEKAAHIKILKIEEPKAEPTADKK